MAFDRVVGAQFIVRTADLSASEASRADKSAMARINPGPTSIHIISFSFIIGAGDDQSPSYNYS
jgi:hypothetical protein